MELHKRGKESAECIIDSKLLLHWVAAMKSQWAEGLRKRQLLNDDTNTLADDPTKDPHNKQQRGRRKLKAVFWLQFTTIALHIAAILIVIYGLKLRAGFHNGDECQMTYSMRNYVPIHTEEGATTATSYNLYKFVDSRDPRHQSLLKATAPIPDNSHCAQDAFVVLYIPGHWGDYSQCRSVGAHGTQLTQSGQDRQFTTMARQALANNSWSGVAEQEENFVYEVYCVDFAEQGAAVHGNFIRKQSQYVAQIVKKLSHECSVPTITLVGHSVGGLVAKAVPVYFPSVGDRIRNIITLATPHLGLPFVFDESMHKVYHDLESLSSDILITSISGGLKDELVPAGSCEAKTGVTRVAGTHYGMDHKAVVWCYQVLEKVRKILFVLSQDETADRKSVVEQVGIVNGSYEHVVAEQKNRYKAQHGYLSCIALESAMLYNIELLLAMYSLLCGFYVVAPKLSPWVGVGYIASMSALFCNHDLSAPSVLVLSLLTSSIFWGLRVALSLLPNKFSRSDLTLRSSAIAAIVAILILSVVLAAVAAITAVLLGKTPRFQARSTLVVALVVWLLAAPISRTNTFDQRSVILAALTTIAVPFLTFGKLVVFGWNVVDDYGELDFAFALKVLVPMTIRYIVGKNGARNNDQPVFIAAHTLNTLLFASGMLQIGGGYLVGYNIAWVSLIEAARLLSG